jgi:integrase
MPADQRGSVDHVKRSWRARWYENGSRRSRAGFRTKSAAAAFLEQRRAELEAIRSGRPLPKDDLTLSEFVTVYLDRHAAGARSRTISSLRQRLGYATRDFGDVSMRELAWMVDELAGWQARLPQRSRYGISGALRQTLGAAVRWGYIGSNPAKLVGPNRQPPPREIRVFTLAEIDAIAAELPVRYRPIPAFAAATGLRPEEWAPLERRDVNRNSAILSVRRTVSDGEVVELAKTSKSRRQVPLSRRALAALDGLPARLDSPLLFPAPASGFLRLDNFRRRVWSPAIEASGVARPARIYDLRSTFVSNGLAAGITVFELARVAGTSVAMIERHYGTLLDGAHAGIASRLDAMETALIDAANAAEGGER